MRIRHRAILAVISFVAGLSISLLILLVLQRPWLVSFYEAAIMSEGKTGLKIIMVSLLLFLFLLSVFAFLYAFFGGRIRKSRMKSTDIGLIDIGTGAIENIALNSAKAAQAGIKTAKARVYAGHNEQIMIELIVVLYSDVEIPLQMAKIQDRVKKDVEKFTGIGVEWVKVRVSRVELIGTQVER